MEFDQNETYFALIRDDVKDPIRFNIARSIEIRDDAKLVAITINDNSTVCYDGKTFLGYNVSVSAINDDHKEKCIYALSSNPRLILYLPNHWLTIEDWEEAINQGLPFRFCPPQFIEDLYMLAAVDLKDNIDMIPEHLRTKELYVDAAGWNYDSTVGLISQEYLEEATRRAIESISITDRTLIPDFLQTEHFWRDVFDEWPLSVEYMPAEYITLDMCIEASRLCAETATKTAIRANILTNDNVDELLNTPKVINYLPDNLITPERRMLAVRRQPNCIIKFPEDSITDEMLDFVNRIDPMLAFAVMPKHKQTQELCDQAINHCALAITQADEKFVTYDHWLKAVSSRPILLKYIPERFLDFEILLTAFQSEPDSRGYIQNADLQIQLDEYIKQHPIYGRPV